MAPSLFRTVLAAWLGCHALGGGPAWSKPAGALSADPDWDGEAESDFREMSHADRDPGLRESYRKGEDLLAQGQWEAAERCFLRIVEADSNDWEAQEKLVQVYQGWGREDDLDRRISVLRNMAYHGLAWRPYFQREEFDSEGRHVVALEKALPGPPSIATLVFQVHDAPGGGFLYSIRVTVKQKWIESSAAGQDTTSKLLRLPGYEMHSLCQGLKRKLVTPYLKPGYAEMKRMALQLLH